MDGRHASAYRTRPTGQPIRPAEIRIDPEGSGDLVERPRSGQPDRELRLDELEQARPEVVDDQVPLAALEPRDAHRVALDQVEGLRDRAGDLLEVVVEDVLDVRADEGALVGGHDASSSVGVAYTHVFGK